MSDAPKVAEVKIPPRGAAGAAWAPLYRALRRPALAAIVRVVGADTGVAEDLWHELFVDIMRRPELLGTLPGAARESYVRVAALRRAMNYRRASTRAATRAHAHSPKIDAVLPTVETKVQVEQLVRKLDPKDQKLLQLKYQDGLTLTEAGVVMGLTSSNVAVRIFRALARLRELSV